MKMQFKINHLVILYLLHIILHICDCAPPDHQPSTASTEVSIIKTTTTTAATISTNNLSNNNGKERKKSDYYEYRHVVADGVRKALDDCRQKFKWERWNCPRKAFHDILGREVSSGNTELAAAAAAAAASDAAEDPQYPTDDDGFSEHPSKFSWAGCEETVKFGFKVSKIYLESQDSVQDEASKLINAHNYEVGRHAVRRHMKVKCKCHGTSGACQVKTCWNVLPNLGEVGEYLRRQYRIAAKVGAMSAIETNTESLRKELSALNPNKLVFTDASPDYCYEHPHLGINGTLNRTCSRSKNHLDGSDVGRSERESCDKLCTKCGYKIKRETTTVEKQCDCRFIYCCDVKCNKCPNTEETFRCVRHS